MSLNDGRARFEVVGTASGWQAILKDRDGAPHPEISGFSGGPVGALAAAVRSARRRKIPVPRIPVRIGEPETRNVRRRLNASEG